MSTDATNPFTHYHVVYLPNGRAAKVGITLDDGPNTEDIAGYLLFWDRPVEELPEDEHSPTSDYIVKHMQVSRAESVLDLLHRQIDLLKRPMVIACAVDASETLRTWLATTSSSERSEVEVDPFFSNLPSISFLNPNTVKQDWEGTVEIHGSNFDSGSFALFNGMVPKTTFKSDSLLEAEVKKNITGTVGTRKVKVHTGSGSLSNEVDFTVT